MANSTNYTLEDRIEFLEESLMYLENLLAPQILDDANRALDLLTLQNVEKETMKSFYTLQLSWQSTRFRKP
jgi:hypothetical protein